MFFAQTVVVHVGSGGWTEVAAIATAVAAAVTAYMAKVTKDVATATKQSAQATEKSAKATEASAELAKQEVEAALKQADATVELATSATRDRELAYQPLLSCEFLGQAGQAYQNVKIVNVGSGPAIDAMFATLPAPGEDAWFRTPLFQISASAEREMKANGETRNSYRAHWFERDKTRPAEKALFCRDIFDNRHRFLIYEGFVFHEVRRRDEVDPSAGEGIWWADRNLWSPLAS